MSPISGPLSRPAAATPSARNRSQSHGSGAEPRTMMMAQTVATALRDATRAPPDRWKSTSDRTRLTERARPPEDAAMRACCVAGLRPCLALNDVRGEPNESTVREWYESDETDGLRARAHCGASGGARAEAG